MEKIIYEERIDQGNITKNYEELLRNVSLQKKEYKTQRDITEWVHHGQTKSKQRCINFIYVEITSFDHELPTGKLHKNKISTISIDINLNLFDCKTSTKPCLNKKSKKENFIYIYIYIYIYNIKFFFIYNSQPTKNILFIHIISIKPPSIKPPGASMIHLFAHKLDLSQFIEFFVQLKTIGFLKDKFGE